MSHLGETDGCDRTLESGDKRPEPLARDGVQGVLAVPDVDDLASMAVGESGVVHPQIVGLRPLSGARRRADRKRPATESC